MFGTNVTGEEEDTLYRFSW